MNKHFNSLCLTGLLFILPVCPATIASAQPAETSDTNAKPTNLLKDELYFGLRKPGGETISESEWQEFVSAVITPRFREGLTVLDGAGQFVNSSGILIRENSKIVILIYESSPEKNQAINEIIETYKRTFQQESVLRATSEVKVSF
ncbi:DUF3574 domain-containing protein [Microcoleus vaginatus PCC 9802]|uniref:DUF3574 domain-containing protein n=1 Tax=Microcoleus vaginatus TaxID=119532 RepID=UPI00020D2FE6|nr:hypothetical protein MicvaDRAFT_5066 [Microcoleus vaginatus FGP-2]UNU19362.1 DUF3574 domain-containing protein [Microcoleus vaginatus PCC 9802]